MSGSRPEFSRLVPLARLARDEPFRQRIAAGEGERAALARRFDLEALTRLEADVELLAERSGTYLLTAQFDAAFAQRCIVTLDPVDGTLSERFALRFGPVEEGDSPAGADEPAFEPLDGEAIDIGEAVAQEFSLALPPFPRRPDAEMDVPPKDESGDGPFAVLGRLSGRGRR